MRSHSAGWIKVSAIQWHELGGNGYSAEWCDLLFRELPHTLRMGLPERLSNPCGDSVRHKRFLYDGTDRNGAFYLPVQLQHHDCIDSGCCAWSENCCANSASRISAGWLRLGVWDDFYHL